MRSTILLLLLVAACAGGRPIRPQSGGDQYLILAEELRGASQQANLYDAVRELRPFWFTRHVRTGDQIAVYLDDQRVGSVNMLQRIPVTSAQAVRYLSPTEAQVRYGPNNQMRPVIAIDTPRRSN
ncbi:MAG: hypothetical protein WD801_02765 [Gemmatimonadaceae bacterium]